MGSVVIKGIKEEVVAYLDRKASELSKISGKEVSRNKYINLHLEKLLRDDLSIHDDKISFMNEKRRQQ